MAAVDLLLFPGIRWDTSKPEVGTAKKEILVKCTVTEEIPMQPNPVNWFEIPVSDIDRAAKFYEAAFGAELAQTQMGLYKMAWFPMEMGGAGAAGTLIQGDGYTPSHQGSLVYLHVPEIDPTLAKIAEAGGKTFMPRMGIGEHGFVTHFEDSEGNRVALHEAPAG